LLEDSRIEAQMDGKKLIDTLTVRNLLSYGNESPDIKLEPLNVLIGPNASGKSNIIEVLSLLRATPNDLTAPIRDGGGIKEWLWKGAKDTPTAEIGATVRYSEGAIPLRYRISFTMADQRLELVDEAIEDVDSNGSPSDVYFCYQQGYPILNYQAFSDVSGVKQRRIPRRLRRENLKPDQSVLSQRKDPDQYPELTYLGNQFANIRIFREWNVGRYTAPRLPQQPDSPEDFLLEDASNLGLVLNNLDHQGVTRDLILERLQQFYGNVERISTTIRGGTVQLFLHEKGLHQPIPATRLSDGTLRYLCLLSILCHPDPPPVVCIEEPELGLHPDIILTLAELLIEASHRTQLVVTTHSDTLVSALTAIPEAVLVCERDDCGSCLRRLEPERLQRWLEKYSLGDLWRMGELGGTRW